MIADTVNEAIGRNQPREFRNVRAWISTSSGDMAKNGKSVASAIDWDRECCPPIQSRAPRQSRFQNTACSERYGNIDEGFIEARHLRPISALEEGVPVTCDIATDFAVLYSSCHRMLPSPTAEAIRLTGLSRTSPQAKAPGALAARDIRRQTMWSPHPLQRR